MLSGLATHTDEDEEMIITSAKFLPLRGLTKIANDKVGIRAADVAVGLRRIPAGFYIAVQHSGREWRTENKSVSVNHDVIEWEGSIPM